MQISSLPETLSTLILFHSNVLQAHTESSPLYETFSRVIPGLCKLYEIDANAKYFADLVRACLIV